MDCLFIASEASCHDSPIAKQILSPSDKSVSPLMHCKAHLSGQLNRETDPNVREAMGKALTKIGTYYII